MPDPEAEARRADELRPERVAEARRAAADAPHGPAGEPARTRYRALTRDYLNRASEEQDRELAARADPPAKGWWEAIAGCGVADERQRLFDRWCREEQELSGLRQERAAVRREAVGRAGAPDVASFLAVSHPEPPERTLACFERGAIVPLDQAIAEAALARRPRSPADVPALATLAAHADLLAESRIVPVLRPLAEFFDGEPPTGRTGPGPRGLASALAGLGHALRTGFLAQLRRPAEVRWVDPAFDVAVRVLFWRLVLSRRFLDDSQLRWNEPARRDLAFEAALAPRRAWTYLCWVLRGGVAGADLDEALRRATGRPATPGDRAAVGEADPAGAAALRGTVLGLLLEERLMSRFGRAWFTVRGARDLLRESWEAERGETAESVAHALGLGTIEPTPILDGCRPVPGVP